MPGRPQATGATGAWKLSNASRWPHGHICDETFAFEVSRLLRPQHSQQQRATTVLDVGAGVGVYGAFFASCRQQRAPSIAWTGIDGSDGVEQLSEGAPGGVSQVNLCNSSADVGVHDWVMSLEVGEHIPRACLASYLRILDRSNRVGAVLSWGHYGQPGIGHITPRAGRDVAAMMRFLGYLEDVNASAVLQGAASATWLAHNARVYRRARPNTDLRFSHEAENLLESRFYQRRKVAQVAHHPCHAKQLLSACASLRNATRWTMCQCMGVEYWRRRCET